MCRMSDKISSRSWKPRGRMRSQFFLCWFDSDRVASMTRPGLRDREPARALGLRMRCAATAARGHAVGRGNAESHLQVDHDTCRRNAVGPVTVTAGGPTRTVTVPDGDASRRARLG